MAQKIYSHTDKRYKCSTVQKRQNGAYVYSKEIVENIIPAVKTKRPWVTIYLGEFCVDHAIYFIHDNLRPERYAFLKKYKDVIAVCGIMETVWKVQEYVDHAIYLPLSVDIDWVKRFVRNKDKIACYAGRKGKPGMDTLDPTLVDMLCDMPRNVMLSEMGRYIFCFAVGRTAIEAAILGCRILPYDPRYPDPRVWQVLSNQEAADILQHKLDMIDKA